MLAPESEKVSVIYSGPRRSHSDCFRSRQFRVVTRLPPVSQAETLRWCSDVSLLSFVVQSVVIGHNLPAIPAIREVVLQPAVAISDACVPSAWNLTRSPAVSACSNFVLEPRDRHLARLRLTEMSRRRNPSLPCNLTDCAGGGTQHSQRLPWESASMARMRSMHFCNSSMFCSCSTVGTDFASTWVSLEWSHSAHPSMQCERLRLCSASATPVTSNLLSLDLSTGTPTFFTVRQVSLLLRRSR